jgi:hypothetical protein
MREEGPDRASTRLSSTSALRQFHIIYVSVNAVRPGQLTRTRRAIRDIRHIFVEADHDGEQLIRTIDGRRDLPRPSYLLHSSPNRVHVFWRASGFTIARAESLQQRLAREPGT